MMTNPIATARYPQSKPDALLDIASSIKICASPLHNVAFARPFFEGAAFFASVY